MENCGNCKWHRYENDSQGWVCCNTDSEYVADWTDWGAYLRPMGGEGRMKEFICFVIVLLFLGLAVLIAELIYVKDEPAENEVDELTLFDFM